MPLEFLVKLNRGQLPVAVTSEADLKCVSILKATGLIDATFAVSGPQDRSFRKIDAALVFAITEAGRDEIAPLIAGDKESPANHMERNMLAVEYLRLLENSTLPVIVLDPHLIDCLDVLSNAGIIVVDFFKDDADRINKANVRQITEVGQDFLNRKFGKNDRLRRRRDPAMLRKWIEQIRS